MTNSAFNTQTPSFLPLVFTIFLCANAQVHAQQVVGRSILNGEKGELLPDKTWRLVDPVEASASCDSLPLGLSFCTGTDWTTPTNPKIAAQYYYDDRNYGQMITEPVGAKDGFSHEFLRNAVIRNAASGTVLRTTDVFPIDEQDIEMGPHSGETGVYGFGDDGVELVFLKTVLLLPRRSFQFVTYSFGKEKTPEIDRIHMGFFSRIKIA